MKKRFFSSLLVVMLMLSMIITFGVDVRAAAPTDLETKSAFGTMEVKEATTKFTNEMLSRAYQVEVEMLAQQVFPEYASQTNAMLGAGVEQSGVLELGDVVYSETRQISETEEMKYVVYSSGRVGYWYVKGWNSTQEYPDIEGTRYIRTLVVTVPGCNGSIYVQGLNYTIRPNLYDMINATGTCYGGVASYNVLDKQYENSSGPAKASYGGNLTEILYDLTIPVAFTVEVGNNTVIVRDPSGTAF